MACLPCLFILSLFAYLLCLALCLYLYGACTEYVSLYFLSVSLSVFLSICLFAFLSACLLFVFYMCAYVCRFVRRYVGLYIGS
jgi:hypothetical protein